MKPINRRHAICNLSMEGYGIVRTLGDKAVTIQSDVGLLVMTNACFGKFLNTIGCEEIF